MKNLIKTIDNVPFKYKRSKKSSLAHSFENKSNESSSQFLM